MPNEPAPSPFTGDLQKYLKGALAHLVQGASADLAAYIEKLARLGAYAAQTNDPALIQELIGQAKLLGELHRIRVVNAGWQVVDDVIVAGVKLLAGALVSAEPKEPKENTA